MTCAQNPWSFHQFHMVLIIIHQDRIPSREYYSYYVSSNITISASECHQNKQEAIERTYKMHLWELLSYFPPLLVLSVSSCTVVCLSFSRSSISSSELVWSRWGPPQRSGVSPQRLRGLDTLGTPEMGSVRVATSLFENTVSSGLWLAFCAFTSREPAGYFGVIEPNRSLSRSWQKHDQDMLRIQGEVQVYRILKE